MFRTIGSSAIRHSRMASRRSVPGLAPSVNFHASLPRAKEEEAAPEATSSSWDPLYALPLGIAFAVPAIQYEWYLVNEETQLAACFIAFTAIVYKQFGGVIQEALEEDGKRVLAEHNAAEDQVISSLQTSIQNIKEQETLVEDVAAIKELKGVTYNKLNEVGKVKPLYDFKAQMEKLLSMIASEEAAMQEKSKIAMMEEATVAVKQAFTANEDLKKAALQSAISSLKGGQGGGKDPVQQAYLSFFAEKKKAAEKIDAAAESKEARLAILSKLNATAMNEGFFFRFDETGKPKMVV